MADILAPCSLQAFSSAALNKTCWGQQEIFSAKSQAKAEGSVHYLHKKTGTLPNSGVSLLLFRLLQSHKNLVHQKLSSNLSLPLNNLFTSIR